MCKASKLSKLRHHAFLNQNGRCYYCGYPMWEGDPKTFARLAGLSLEQAKRFQCTAEHLQARQDGGRDVEENIVAACVCCNQRRHYLRPAPDPARYRSIVQKHLAIGSWHRKVMRKLLEAITFPQPGTSG